MMSFSALALSGMLATPGSVCAQSSTTAPSAPAPATKDATVWYPVSSINVAYGADPQPLSIARLREAEIALGLAYGGGLTGLEERSTTVTVRLSEIGKGEYTRLDAAAIRVITQSLVREFEKSGIIGVAALPDPDQIEVIGAPADLRKADDTTLRIFLFVGVVKEIRSVAVEADDPESRRVNPDTTFHNRLRANSPLRRGDVLDREKLDEYVARSSRHPGRRVDLAISAAGEEQGGATLDFVVSEAKPWLAYFQLSNTGTRETSEWRERFGFLHTNLTGNDDILQIDYITANFQESHAVNVSYEYPILERLRLKGFGGYNTFTASDVGQQLFTFEGEGYNLGIEASYEIAYVGGFFVDAVGGVRYDHTETRRELPGPDQNGRGSYFVPYGGFKAERNTQESNFSGSVVLEYYANTEGSFEDLQELGRIDPDENWPLIKWDFAGSFYVEPLLYPQEFAEGTGGPNASLAHEFFFNLRGQYSFSNRLIPTVEQTLGGFSTVRGYPESLLAGDSSVVFTSEYRLHIPPLLGYNSTIEKGERQDFRFRPTEPWGVADWDLIVRGFLDAGYVDNTDERSFEQSETLVGAGVGLELQILRYLNARLDWGFALKGATTTQERVDVGDSRLHFVLTVSF